MTKDYYKILGIAEFDSAEDIKNAYRKLARKWHPDIAGNTKDALLKFKEINEAYEILSNKVKKEEYDRARRFYSYAKGEASNNAKSNTTSQTEQKNESKQKNNFSFKWEDFISSLSREKSFRKQEEILPKKGADVYSDVEITIMEAVEGTTKVISMLQTQTCPKCKGRKFTNGTTCPHCKGKGEFTSYKKFNIKIPARIKDLSKIRLAGEGGKGINGGTNGDMYVTIHIIASNDYRIDGLNVYKTLPIAPYEAVLGANIKVNTITGNYVIKINPNTQNGQKIRLSGCGIVQNRNVGDMIITVEIKIPKNLSAQEVELYKKLEEVSSSNLRDQFYDR